MAVDILILLSSSIRYLRKRWTSGVSNVGLTLMVFSMSTYIFSAMILTFTRVKRHELFAVVAAYAAVLCALMQVIIQAGTPDGISSA